MVGYARNLDIDLNGLFFSGTHKERVALFIVFAGIRHNVNIFALSRSGNLQCACRIVCARQLNSVRAVLIIGSEPRIRNNGTARKRSFILAVFIGGQIVSSRS